MPTFSVLLAIGTILTLLSSASGRSAQRRQLRTTNVNPAYKTWPGGIVPFYIDQAFTQAQSNMIRMAIAQVAGALPVISAMAPCLTFKEVLNTTAVFKIRFTPLTGPLGAAGTTNQTYCFSYPGISDATQATALEQVVSLSLSPSTGCMNSSCQIMKYIVLSLGKRNEHQRGDRDSYITMNNANLLVPSAYTLYVNLVDAYWGLYPYDYCSITHNRQTDFAYPGALAFTLPATAPFNSIPNLCAISLTDCRLISMLYGCPSQSCTQPTCSIQGQATATTPATTGTSTSTTGFCTVSSAYNVNSPATFPLTNATVSEGAQTASQLNPAAIGIADYITRKHNCLRSGVNPPAANMLQMVWNAQAASQAQSWASNCVYAHNAASARTTSQFGCGQNIAMSTGGAISWNQVMNLWYNEVNSYVYGGANNGPTDTGHYSQMVWATTFQVGCGWASCSNFNFYVCNYCPAGNIVTASGIVGIPYVNGTPCSSCKNACQSNLLCTNSCPYTNGYSNCDELNTDYAICAPSNQNSALNSSSCQATCNCQGDIY